jgi:hypothetical protein
MAEPQRTPGSQPAFLGHPTPDEAELRRRGEDLRLVPEAAPLSPDGPASAVLVATGIGVFVIGLVTTLSEASSSVSDALNWWNSVGPLSGKTVVGVVAWLVSWGVLYGLWRRRSVRVRTGFIVMLVLVALGFVFTFPPFFELFASD